LGAIFLPPPKMILINFGNFFTSDIGKLTNNVAAVPPKMMMKAAGLTRAIKLAPFKIIATATASKARIIPISVDESLMVFPLYIGQDYIAKV
jgi:hypothetical protein